MTLMTAPKLQGNFEGHICDIGVHWCIGVEFMKSNELRQKSKSELQRFLAESRERLRALRFDLASGKVKNVREIRKIKKDIARVLTILKEK